MTILRYIWASPNTLLGLLFALMARLTGGRASVVTGVVEAYGGVAAPVLRRLPFVRGGAAAITFGHVVLAQTQTDLDRTRPHERVHVRQYERWGPLFLPAYLISSLIAATRGLDPYLNNAFEEEAYNESS
ncbi:MAG: hypothetical protein ACYTGQ_06480 [Planctomycetota bacterium]